MTTEAGAGKRLSFIDRFLMLWIRGLECCTAVGDLGEGTGTCSIY